eukprot:1144943-Pelagomonas_calceolata.AAC.5
MALGGFLRRKPVRPANRPTPVENDMRTQGRKQSRPELPIWQTLMSATDAANQELNPHHVKRS